MQNSVSAIRAGRPGARFVLPPVHRRDRRLGLHRLFRTVDTRSEQRRDAAAQAPLRALRDAARGLTAVAADPGATGVLALRRAPQMRWADDVRPRARTAAPWRV